MIQKTLLLFVVLLLSAITITAQANINGALKGRTTDETDASIGGANALLTNTETGKEFSATSDEAGNYSFPVVAPGVYRLTIEKQNFKRLVRENIIISVGETATANVALSIGGISETVTIESGADIVQTNSAEISQLVDESVRLIIKAFRKCRCFILIRAEHTPCVQAQTFAKSETRFALILRARHLRLSHGRAVQHHGGRRQ